MKNLNEQLAALNAKRLELAAMEEEYTASQVNEICGLQNHTFYKYLDSATDFIYILKFDHVQLENNGNWSFQIQCQVFHFSSAEAEAVTIHPATLKIIAFAAGTYGINGESYDNRAFQYAPSQDIMDYLPVTLINDIRQQQNKGE